MRMFWFFTNKAWLEGNLKGKAFGAYDERERIIKLLESKSECKPISGRDWNGNCYCEVIALIKGEK